MCCPEEEFLMLQAERTVAQREVCRLEYLLWTIDKKIDSTRKRVDDAIALAKEYSPHKIWKLYGNSDHNQDVLDRVLSELESKRKRAWKKVSSEERNWRKAKKRKDRCTDDLRWRMYKAKEKVKKLDKRLLPYREGSRLLGSTTSVVSLSANNVPSIEKVAEEFQSGENSNKFSIWSIIYSLGASGSFREAVVDLRRDLINSLEDGEYHVDIGWCSFTVRGKAAIYFFFFVAAICSVIDSYRVAVCNFVQDALDPPSKEV